ncbi:MAG TPA: Dyp-type peroxidase [Kouleothrix sp.]|nr:Dyp-type peroxidase [Kouleothrix sp.]
MPPRSAAQAADTLPLRTSDEIQGNILAGFNKDFQTFLFIQLTNAAKGRAWLGDLAPRIATTRQVAAFNDQFSAARRATGGDDPQALKATWVNIGLSATGLRKLVPGLGGDIQRFTAFDKGAAARAADLRDRGLSAPERWLFGGPGQPQIDAVLTIAADDPGDLQLEIDRQRALLSQHGHVLVFEQRGETLPGERAGHEHFGFKDGVSQPGVRGFHPAEPTNPNERLGHPGTEMIAAGEFILGQADESGTPASIPGWMANGSFQVFRRLSQDVPGWWAQVTANAQSLAANDPMRLHAEQMAAKLVGRWRSGTPLAHAPEQDSSVSGEQGNRNDFNYDDDANGFKTPRFAHIRKMYPRNSGFGDRSHRIMRRGIPFGAPFDPAAGAGHGLDGERGLLFNVFQASIENQFEFLQQTWANNNFFQQPGDGPDPVIGDADDASCTFHRDGRPDTALSFQRFVNTSGALYAFAPSLTTIRGIASGTINPPPDDTLHVGDTAFVQRAGGLPLRLRDKPSLSGKVLSLLAPGTQLTLLEGPRAADGHPWWRVRAVDGREGWAAGDNIRKQPD